MRQHNLKGNADLTYDEFVRREEDKQQQRDVDAEALRLAKAAAATKAPLMAANLFEGLDLAAVTDLVSSLPLEWQATFRRDVARTKAYIATFADADPVVSLIEAYIFLDFVIRAISIGIMAGRLNKQTTETIDILLRRRTEMASALEITPEAKRKRGGPTEATIADALEASQKAVAEARPGRSDRKAQMARMLDDKMHDAVRSLKPAEDDATGNDGG